jgi:hypothetical protein
MTTAAAAEALARALGRARYRVAAGLAGEEETRAALAAHPATFDRAARDAALARWREAAVGEDGDEPRARLALLWTLDLAVLDAALPLDADARDREAGLRVPLADGTALHLGEALRESARARDRDRRLAVADALFRVAGDSLGPLRAERLRREWELTASLGLGDPAAARARLLGADAEALRTLAERLLSDTADIYADALGRLAQRRLGLPVGRLARADLGVLFDAPEIHVPSDGAALVAMLRAQLAEAGLDADGGGRVRWDLEPRPGKRPRASCIALAVPDEVALLLLPTGSIADCEALWHEAGHALHLTSVAREAAFEERWLVDEATAEGIAQLFGRIPAERAWLARSLRLGRPEAEAAARGRATAALFLARRYAARLLAELEGWAAADPALLRGRWAERLSEATLVRYRPEEALLDVDAGLRSAAYVRGGVLAAALAEAMRERFDEDWFRNPAAGPALAQLLSHDRAASPGEVAAAEGAAADAGAVLRAAERALG